MIHGVARQAQSSVAETLERVRASAVVHADETGWRQDGVNGYVWTFSTPTERYFVRGGRNKEVVDEVLGDCFSGVLVSDFYAAYNHYPGLKQRCWAHLLRDVRRPSGIVPPRHRAGPMGHCGASALPKGEGSRQHSASVRTLALGISDATGVGRAAAGAFAVRTTMTRRRHRPDSAGAYGSSSKSCSYSYPHSQVPPDNNQAERSLRHLVVSRKISGGTRSSNGHQKQDGAGVPVRRMASKGPQPLLRMPQPARFTLTLNSYKHVRISNRPIGGGKEKRQGNLGKVW